MLCCVCVCMCGERGVKKKRKKKVCLPGQEAKRKREPASPVDPPHRGENLASLRILVPRFALYLLPRRRLVAHQRSLTLELGEIRGYLRPHRAARVLRSRVSQSRHAPKKNIFSQIHAFPFRSGTKPGKKNKIEKDGWPERRERDDVRESYAS